MLFDETTLRKLNQLTLVATRVRAGMMKGERRSTRRGTSIEFADYRNYTSGDDLRRLDWNIYARLDRPFIKLLEEEEDLAVHILLDASTSMDWGEGELHKFTYARRLAAALGTIALNNGDRLSLAVLRGGSASDCLPPLRGSLNLMRLLGFLEGQSAQGVTDLNLALANYALAAQRPGLAFLISDLFSPGSVQEALAHLLARGYEVVLLHVLAPDEIHPPLAGDLRLVDSETGQAVEVSLDAGLRDLYQRRVEEWRAEIQRLCLSRSIHYLALQTDQPWDKVVLTEMRRVGVVKS